MTAPPKTRLVFYAAASGREPVRDWLKELNVEDATWRQDRSCAVLFSSAGALCRTRLHKKSQKTPKAELDLALRRKKDIENGG